MFGKRKSCGKKILAVASGGGHWIQLLRVRPAFEGHRVVFVTVDPTYRCDIGDERFYAVNDATRWDRIGMVTLALRLGLILLKERPHIVLSTGAAPGYIALRLGKLLGAKTVWIDSIANIERLSLSGERIKPHADLCLTQWSHLARPDGPTYGGAVL